MKMLTRERVEEISREIARTIRPIVTKAGAAAKVTPKFSSYSMELSIRLDFPNEKNVVQDEYAERFCKLIRMGSLPGLTVDDLGKEIRDKDNNRYVIRGARKRGARYIVAMNLMSRQLIAFTLQEVLKMPRG